MLSTARPRPRGTWRCAASAGSRPSAAGSTGASWARILYVEEHGFETIQGELALTRDEVADVLGSVYRKLGVGDKQEALDFIHSVSE